MDHKSLWLLCAGLLLAGCAAKPWYHKLEAKNPQCVESLKTVRCEDFVNETLLMRRQALQVLHHPGAVSLDAGNLRFLNTLVAVTSENLEDVGECPR